MSMWLSLAKISPEILAEVRARPDLLDAFFFDDHPTLPAGVSRRADMLGCDYLTLSAVADAKTREEFGGDDWREHLTWLVRATGEDEGDVIEGYEFCYGPAFVLTAPEVVAVAEGLAAEGWDFTDLNLAFELDDELEPELDSQRDDDPDADPAEPSAAGGDARRADLERTTAAAEDADEDDAEADEDDDAEAHEDPEFDDFVDLLPFFAAAAREGKAVVGGIG